MEDFPAAHSMDTCWFAVDGDGHVAFFDSAEQGCVPEHVTDQSEGLEALDSFAEAAEPGDALLDPRAIRLPGPLAEPHLEAREAAGGHFVMFLRSTDAVAAELSSGQAEVIKALGGAAVLFRSPGAEVYDRLHRGICLGCTYGPRFLDPRAKDLPAHDMPSRYGFYHYVHDDEPEFAAPYLLEAHPAEPLFLEALPHALRRLAGRNRFEGVCFAESPHLQPADFFACQGWVPTFLSTDGKTVRPLPGKHLDEEELEEVAAKGVKLVHEPLRFGPPKPDASDPTTLAGIADWLRKLFGR